MFAASLRLSAVFSVASSAAAPAQRRIEPTESDGELVRRAKGGNRWAEEALYHRHVRLVTRVVTRLLSRTAEAEDVVQDAFVIALQELPKLRDEESFGPWLLRIAVRQVHRRFRKRRLLRLLGLDQGADDATLSEHADPTAGPEMKTLLSEVDDVLRTLPPRARVAWMLRHVEGHELLEVARACECSLATVKRVLGRAEAAISKRVEFEPREGVRD